MSTVRRLIPRPKKISILLLTKVSGLLIFGPTAPIRGAERKGEMIATLKRQAAELKPVRDDAAELLMRDVRELLGRARQHEACNEIELAEGLGATAANKLARSYRLACPVIA